MKSSQLYHDNHNEVLTDGGTELRRRGDVGARQLVDQLHEDGRDGRAQWEYKVTLMMMLMVTSSVMMVMMIMSKLINYMKIVEMDGLIGKIGC